MVPSRIRSVTPAQNASAVYPSSISFSGGPTISIWKKWSIIHRLAIPADSADRAMVVKVAPRVCGDPGQVKLGTCSPRCMARILSPQRLARPRCPPALWTDNANDAGSLQFVLTALAEEGEARDPRDRLAHVLGDVEQFVDVGACAVQGGQQRHHVGL